MSIFNAGTSQMNRLFYRTTSHETPNVDQKGRTRRRSLSICFQPTVWVKQLIQVWCTYGLIWLPQAGFSSETEDLMRRKRKRMHAGKGPNMLWLGQQFPLLFVILSSWSFDCQNPSNPVAGSLPIARSKTTNCFPITRSKLNEPFFDCQY